MDSTEAAVLCELGQPLRLLELGVPDPKPGQVVVDIACSGVCRSQLLEVWGHRGPDRFLPHALGHEGAGRVVGIGPGVTKVGPGSRVVLSWIKGRGADVPSTVYKGPYGPVSAAAIATFMRRAVVSENRVTPIPESVPWPAAALLGCAVPTGAGIIFNTVQPKPGETIAVFGVGGIGLNAVMAATIAGASVIAVDVLDDKLEHARRAGAAHQLNARRDDPEAAIRFLTRGRGVDYAVEAAGEPRVIEAAFRSVREDGGLLIVAGNVAYGQRISLDPFDLIRGKRIVGSWGGETDPDRDIPLYVDLYLSGRLPLDSLVTNTYSLAAVNDALADLERGSVGRAVIDMSLPVADPRPASTASGAGR